MNSKLLYVVPLLVLCSLELQAQFEPYFGSGSATLSVPMGSTVLANETRAKGIRQNTGNGITFNIEYENLENGPLDPNAWFLIIATDEAPLGRGSANYYFTKATSGIFESSATKGEIKLQDLPPSPIYRARSFQIVQVDEYSSALIEGILSVDPYDPLKGHGGVLCLLIDGNMNFGANGLVDVSECGFNGTEGGKGGAEGTALGAGAAAPSGLNKIGNDATPSSKIFDVPTRDGEKIINIDVSCVASGQLEGLKGGKSTGRVFGTEGSNAGIPFDPENDNYNDTLLTMGAGGKGGDGGKKAASAGGNGGSGATNGLHGGYLDNSFAGAGPGGSGTNPIPAAGFTDGDAGDGGNGGAGGGIIYIRAKTYTCQPATVHFRSDGGNGGAGTDGHGGGGIGGFGGKGSDGGCSEDANGGSPYIFAAGGNGATGKGGNGAHGGSGGNGGEAGTIWLLYDVNASSLPPEQLNCTESHGAGGGRGLGGYAGQNGQQYKAHRSAGSNCYCGGAPVVQYKNYGSECACEENFKKLEDMEPDGLTPDGFKQWKDPTSNAYCYYNDVENRLICKETESQGSPTHTVITRTSLCGEFDCPWVDNLFDDTHNEDAEIVLEDGQAVWIVSGVEHTFTFESGTLSDGTNDCTKSCDPQVEEESNESDAPKPGLPGKDGTAPTGPAGPATIVGISDNLPPMALPKQEWDFALYPNPAGEVLYLNNIAASHWNYEIVNAQGQSLLQGKGTGSHTTIAIALLPQGTYFVRLSVNGQQRIQSFEKQ